MENEKKTSEISSDKEKQDKSQDLNPQQQSIAERYFGDIGSLVETISQSYSKIDKPNFAKQTSTEEEQPTPTAEEQPTPTAEQQSTPTAEEQPTPTAEQQPTPTAEQQPKPTAEQQPEPTAEEQPTPTVEEQPKPTAEEQPTPTAEQQPTPTAEGQPEPTAEEQPTPTVEEQPKPTAEEQPEPTAEEQSKPQDDRIYVDPRSKKTRSFQSLFDEEQQPFDDEQRYYDETDYNYNDNGQMTFSPLEQTMIMFKGKQATKSNIFKYAVAACSMVAVCLVGVIVWQVIAYNQKTAETFAPFTEPKYIYVSPKQHHENYILSLEQIDYESIDKSMKALTKDFGNRGFENRGNLLTAEYLVNSLEQFGYTGEQLVVQEYYYDYSPPEGPPEGLKENIGMFPAPGTRTPIYQENIVAIVKGKSENCPIITVSGHYDSHTEGQGAIDNASGVSSMLAMAEKFKKHNIAPNCEIRFLFLSTEEFGYHGAVNYFKQLSNEEFKRHVAAINIDMSGHDKNRPDSVLAFSSMGSISIQQTKVASKQQEIPNIVSSTLSEMYVKYSDGFAKEIYPEALLFKDDARIFFNRGINVSTVSWREIDIEKSFNRHGLVAPAIIHTTEDVYENIDINSIVKTSNLVFKATLMLDFTIDEMIQV